MLSLQKCSLPDVTYGYIVFYSVQQNVFEKKSKTLPGTNKPKQFIRSFTEMVKIFVMKIVNIYWEGLAHLLFAYIKPCSVFTLILWEQILFVLYGIAEKTKEKKVAVDYTANMWKGKLWIQAETKMLYNTTSIYAAIVSFVTFDPAYKNNEWLNFKVKWLTFCNVSEDYMPLLWISSTF